MKKKSFITKILLLIILFVYAIFLTPKQFQNDTLFDISLGEKYINYGINTNDDFSIHDNLEYTSQHFLVNIITYCIYSSFNFHGLYILNILLTCTLALLLFWANNLFSKSKITSYLFVFIELLVLCPFISLRAQMYSYILFLLELIFIENFLRSKKYIYLALLSIIPLALINFHAGTIYLYFIIIFVYLLNYIPINMYKLENNCEYVTKLKYLLIPFVIGLFVIFINPFGIDQITYCFKTLSNSYINNNISEFKPLNIKTSIGITFFLYLAMIITSFIYTKKKIKLEDLLLFLGTGFMSLMTIRHVSLFILLTIPCLYYIEDIILRIKSYLFFGLIEKYKKVLKIFVISIFLIFNFIISILKFIATQASTYLPQSIYPIQSVKYIKEHIGDNSRLYNEYIYGSLLMFNHIKVFIDSRCDLYTKDYSNGCEVAEDYSKIINCSENYEELLKKYDIQYLLISKKSALAKNIFNNSKYQKIFEDEISYVIKVN